MISSIRKTAGTKSESRASLTRPRKRAMTALLNTAPQGGVFSSVKSQSAENGAGELCKMRNLSRYRRKNPFVKGWKTRQNRQNAENYHTNPGVRCKKNCEKNQRKNAKKGLDNPLFLMYTGRVSQNGIERPKGILPVRQKLKICEKCQRCILSQWFL